MALFCRLSVTTVTSPCNEMTCFGNWIPCSVSLLSWLVGVDKQQLFTNTYGVGCYSHTGRDGVALKISPGFKSYLNTVVEYFI